jgi:hypothetical protein
VVFSFQRIALNALGPVARWYQRIFIRGLCDNADARLNKQHNNSKHIEAQPLLAHQCSEIFLNAIYTSHRHAVFCKAVLRGKHVMSTCALNHVSPQPFPSR